MNTRIISTMSSRPRISLVSPLAASNSAKLLAQQRDQQADRVAKLAARDQAGQFRLAFGRCALAEVGETFGLIDDQLQAQNGDVVADARLEPQKRLPECGVGFGEGHALHQADQDDGKAWLVSVFGAPGCMSRVEYRRIKHGLAEDHQRHGGLALAPVRVGPDDRLGVGIVDQGAAIIGGEAQIGDEFGQALLDRDVRHQFGQGNLVPWFARCA